MSILPQADTKRALKELLWTLWKLGTIYPEAAFIVAGDFNKANLRTRLPKFHQHIDCTTRGGNTLDVCSSVLELFLSIDVLYYVILYYVSYFVWTPGRVAAAFATTNGDPNKIPNTTAAQTSAMNTKPSPTLSSANLTTTPSCSYRLIGRNSNRMYQ